MKLLQLLFTFRQVLQLTFVDELLQLLFTYRQVLQLTFVDETAPALVYIQASSSAGPGADPIKIFAP